MPNNELDTAVVGDVAAADTIHFLVYGHHELNGKELLFWNTIILLSKDTKAA